jgi:NADH dehydrogenase
MSNNDRQLDVVTGAYGYIGKYIAARLVGLRHEVQTLTGHPDRPDPFGGKVRAIPFHFDDPAALRRSLQGVSTLYNTYWVRFDRRDVTFDRAVRNSKVLVEAAAEAGVRRLVHISITNPSADSSLPYFRGKALVEQAIASSGLSYAVLRPTVLFGGEDILINNVAWLLRHFPLFAVPGDGDYYLQPVCVEDLAQLAIRAAKERRNMTIDAVGPEVYTFNDLVRMLAGKVRARARVIHVRPGLALAMSGLIGTWLHDVVLTADELSGLMSNLLVSGAAPTGRTRLSDWVAERSAGIGVRYASELARHYR